MQEFDVLVVGGGASGLRAAIAAKNSGASVGLITKVHPLRTNSGLAQGGLNAPLGKDDSPDLFAQDTLAAGDGLSEPAIVRTLAREASKDVLWLERMGVPFNRDKDGKLDRRPFGANSRNRTCYTDDRTGYIVLQVLHEQFQRAQIPAFEEWYVTALAMDGAGCLGAIALGLRSGKVEAFASRAVILATGGFTRLYLPSTVSVGTTGDGQSLAYQVGARLMDMEMIQFHPTVYPKGQSLLMTEAALGEGAKLVDQAGTQIQESRSAPREKICLSLLAAAQDGGVFLDFRPLGKERLLARFPQTHELVRAIAGLDILKDPVPIRPVAHRPMGGIETDADGKTSIPGLFAVGECASNGLHGGGRLAGNTLTEALVFGRRTGEAAAAFARAAPRKSFPVSRLSDEENRLTALASGNSSVDSPGKIHAELGQIMNEKMGLMREGAGLTEALNRIRELKERYGKIRVRNASRIYNYDLTSYLELGSMLNLAEAATLAAEARAESRGAQHRSDFSQKDDQNWKCHTIVGLVQGAPRLEKKPVSDHG